MIQYKNKIVELKGVNMTKRKTARVKGSQFEIDSEHSLRPIYPDIRRTGGEGMYMQYDLQTDNGKIVFECKRLKGISWNELTKLLDKLNSVKPEGYGGLILFKSNFQPCLVFNGRYINTFMNYFNTSFHKHKPVQRRKNVKRLEESNQVHKESGEIRETVD